MNRIKKTLGAFIIASVLLIVPAIASAHGIDGNAKAGLGVSINADGIVRVVGAEVSSVSGSIINAFTELGSIVMNWAVSISSTTAIFANGSWSASTSAITAGEKISFSGKLTGAGATMSVAADTVHDMSTTSKKNGPRSVSGEVESVSSTTSSFTIERGNRTITIETNADTEIIVERTSASFGSIAVGDKIHAKGSFNADGSVFTATKIAVKHSKVDEDKDEDNDDRRGPRGVFRMIDRIFERIGLWDR